MSDRESELEYRLAALGYPPHVAKAGSDELIRRWEEFVAHVERGYGLNLEDYLNDLDLRTILGEAGLGNDPRVREADRRLQRVLVRTQDPLWPGAPETAFWNWGYPHNAEGDLAEDLEKEGWLRRKKPRR